MSGYRPLSPDALARELAEVLLRASAGSNHPTRVAIDGPACAAPDRFADVIADRLRVEGRPAAVVRAESYWRDASVRLEYGHTDVDSYFAGWLDRDALIREVLDPLGPDGSMCYLAALRDPVTNRSVHAPALALAAPAVLIVAGDLLLGRGLPLDLSVHLDLSPAARERRTHARWRWTLPALERYDEITRPTAVADIVITWNDPARPALRCTAPQ